MSCGEADKTVRRYLQLSLVSRLWRSGAQLALAVWPRASRRGGGPEKTEWRQALGQLEKGLIAPLLGMDPTQIQTEAKGALDPG